VRHNGRVSLPQSDTHAKTTTVLLGVATVVAQALLLRESMAAMGGSEIAWGVVMALWLAGMGVGARIGISVGSPKLSGHLPALVIGFAGCGVVALRAAPALLGATSGESLTTASASWLWAIAVLPAAFAGGLGFPILAQRLGNNGGGRAYALEAAGALVGGVLLSLALVNLGAAGALTVTFGLVAAASVWHRNRGIALLFAVAGFAIAGPAAELLAQAGWRWSGNPGALRAWRETRLQHIEAAAGLPTTVYADGRLLASYPDPYTILPRAHLLMLLHPKPRTVFAVGCVADGSVEAMARHPVERLVVVEEDPELLRQLPGWYGPGMQAALSASAVHAVATDPLRAMTRSGPWDLVVLRDGNPTTLRRNRTRTLEFLRRCRANMSPDGILVLRVAVSDTYLGGGAGRLLAVLVATVKKVFPSLALIPGQEVLIVAGGPEADLNLDHQVLGERLASRRIEGSELFPEMIPFLLDADRRAELEAELSIDAAPNTIRNPRAVLLAGGLHEGRSRHSLLRAVGLGAVVLWLLVAAVTRHPPALSTAGVVGFSSMGWWLLLIASWQATRGSVYSEIGALTAVFMGGLAAGAAVANRWPRPERWLPAVLCAGCFVSTLVAVGLAVTIPLVTIPPLLLAAGLLTGLAFPGLTALIRRKTRRSAGVVFAADEAGAALAALVIGVFAIPWAGLTATALGLATLQIAAIPAVVVALRR